MAGVIDEVRKEFSKVQGEFDKHIETCRVCKNAAGPVGCVVESKLSNEIDRLRYNLQELDREQQAEGTVA